MYADLVKERPENLPDFAVWPQPDNSTKILLCGHEEERGFITPSLPLPPFEDVLTLAIADPFDGIEQMSDEDADRYRREAKELDRKLTIIGGIFAHPTFTLPWDRTRLAHYRGLIYRSEAADVVAKLVNAGCPDEMIILVDWNGDRVWPV
jgi:hypothetical protein